jgi:hypothetical protein
MKKTMLITLCFLSAKIIAGDFQNRGMTDVDDYEGSSSHMSSDTQWLIFVVAIIVVFILYILNKKKK